MAINGKTGGKSARAVGGGGLPKSMKGNAPGSVKRRTATPSALKGSTVKSGIPTGTKGSKSQGGSGKSQKTTIGNRRAGFAKTGVMRPNLGGKQF